MSDEGGGGVPDWILTYGDMMSLLLCFFILLYAFSGGEKAAPEPVLEALIKQFGDPHQLQMFMLNRQMSAIEKPGKAITENRKASIQRSLANAAQPGRPGHRTRVTDIRDGERLIIGGPILFEPGTADLTEEAKEAILDIAATMRGKFHMIEVKAFEPPTKPIGTKFDSTVDLAFARARAVTAVLVRDGKIHPEIIRQSVAAPLESQSLPPMASGEPMYDRVVISNLEASTSDFVDPAQTTH